MNKRWILFLIISVLLLTTVGFTRPQKQAYEFKMVFSSKNDIPKDVTALGADGWQLVSVKDYVSGGSTMGTYYYLQRAR